MADDDGKDGSCASCCGTEGRWSPAAFIAGTVDKDDMEAWYNEVAPPTVPPLPVTAVEPAEISDKVSTIRLRLEDTKAPFKTLLVLLAGPW